MTRVSIGPNGRVACRAVLRLPMSPGRAWGELRDFARYASHDAFHAGFRIEPGPPRRGARLLILHSYLGVCVQRVGRIVRWVEWDAAAMGGSERAAGYSFSDLSRRGPRRGFPHVLSYYLRDSPDGGCSLEIVVRGRWTASFVPRPFAWLWLRWVFAHVVVSVRNDLLSAAINLANGIHGSAQSRDASSIVTERSDSRNGGKIGQVIVVRRDDSQHPTA